VTKGQSLYWRTIGVITVVMSLAAVALGAAAWYYARLAADDAYDRLLIGAALQIAEGIYIHEGVVGVDPPIATFETLALAPNDRIFYKVTDPGGRVLTGYDDFELAAPGKPAKTEPIVVDGEHLGLGLRVAVVGRYIADIASPGWAQVVLGQTREARLELARGRRRGLEVGAGGALGLRAERGRREQYGNEAKLERRHGAISSDRR